MSKSSAQQALDPKSLVTPHAFKIADNVLFKPLASPSKRALAIAVDGLLVAALAENAGWIFVVMVVVTVLVHKHSQTFGKVVKWALYVFMLAGMVYALMGENEQPHANSENGEASAYNVTATQETETLQTVAQLANFLPEVIAASACQDYQCAQTRMASLNTALVDSTLSSVEQTRILEELIDDFPLSDKQKALLNSEFVASIKQATVEGGPLETLEGLMNDSDAVASHLENESANVNQESREKVDEHLGAATSEHSPTSPLAWLIGFLNDMGLGFGWAAFYFTVFTAWFDGQTLGKKLFGIAVIQLDGSKITLWAAFGRYGGYAAGFTTGLLGFLQIFWDANRQAIQDKISATVVVDLKKDTLESAELAVDLYALNASTHTKVEDS